ASQGKWHLAGAVLISSIGASHNARQWSPLMVGECSPIARWRSKEIASPSRPQTDRGAIGTTNRLVRCAGGRRGDQQHVISRVLGTAPRHESDCTPWHPSNNSQ